MIEFRIEGQLADETWHTIAGPLPVEGDHLAHRNDVIRVLRKNGVGRYRKVRLLKVITSYQVIGEDIPV